jgi:hypothetical protein
LHNTACRPTLGPSLTVGPSHGGAGLTDVHHARCCDPCSCTRHGATMMAAPGTVGATTPHRDRGRCPPRVWSAMSQRCVAGSATRRN